MNNEIIEQPSWWKRNWKWALPTGGCLTIIIIILSFIGYGAYKMTTLIPKDSSVFAFGKVIRTVQEHPVIIETLGKPIDMKVDDYDPLSTPGIMELDFILEGSKSDGVLKVSARKVEDIWVYDVFTVTFDDTQEVLDLREKLVDKQ